jgi:predicted TIM-barrel fold metal-dependent hydrolase
VIAWPIVSRSGSWEGARGEARRPSIVLDRVRGTLSLTPSAMIDMHTHTQPTAEEGKAFADRYAFDSERQGTVAELLATMRRNDVTRSMIVPWLPAQDLVAEEIGRGVDRDEAVERVVGQWKRLNRWATDAVAAHPDLLSCLVGVDPVLMGDAGVASEITEQLASGACGIKVAPMFIYRRPDDEVMEVVWRSARDHGVFVLSQSGASRKPGDAEAWGHPTYFDAVLRAYPTVTVQLAHLGIGAELDVAVLTSRHQNVVADTSMQFWHVEPNELVETIRRIGTDRVLFGTNYPLVDQGACVEAFKELPFTEEERHDIGCANASRLVTRTN